MPKSLRDARVLVVTGAGISAESGIPTFRGAGGHWRNHNAQQLATEAGFRAQRGNTRLMDDCPVVTPMKYIVGLVAGANAKDMAASVECARDLLRGRKSPPAGHPRRTLRYVNRGACRRSAEPHKNLPMATILVVEDDPGLSHYITTMLVSDGHVALTASTSERAREHLRAEAGIALVMLDQNLGRDSATGLALLVALRRAPLTAELPVIVCTGECRPEILNRFLPHQIAAFIRKPFHPQRLMADVRRVVDEAAARERSQRREHPQHVIRSVEA